MKIILFIFIIIIYPLKSISQESDLTISITNDAILPIELGHAFNLIITARNEGPDTASSISSVSISNNVSIITSDCSGFIIQNIILWNSGVLTNQSSFSCSVNIIVNVKDT